MAGTFRVGDGGPTANAGGTAIITYGGTINTSASTNRAVDIQDRAAGAGNITLSGVITHSSGNASVIFMDGNAAGTILFSAANSVLNGGTSDAVHLTNNGGATINFTGGGLNIDATSGGGFVATGGGTVNVTGTVNTIDTGTGTALNVANTTIGASDLTFEHISANGGTNGIVLNTTGSSGGLTVTGDGGSTNNGSGGTIQNTTSRGISLTSTRDISFDQVNISSTGGSGVNGTGVTNFTYTNGTVTNAGNSNLESALGFNATGTGVGEKLGNNLSGTLTVTGNTLTNAFYGGLDVEGDAGTITSATVSNNVITNPGFSGVNFGGSGTATTAFSLNDADIANNNITGSGGNGIQISIGNGNTGASGAGAVAHAGLVTIDGSGRPVSNPSNIISITGNSITLDAGGTQAITVANTSASAAARTQTNFEIQNNGTLASPLDGSDIGTVVLIGNNGFSDMAGVVNNNVIDPNHTSGVAGGGGNGIGGGNGTGGIPGTNYTPRLSLVVTNNDISDVNGPGILLVSRSGTAPPDSGSGKAYFKIANNTVDAPNNTGGSVREGIQVHAGNSDSLDEVYLNIFGNTSAGSNGTVGIGLRKEGSSINVNDFAIFDAPAAPTLADNPTNAQVESFLATLNPGSANRSRWRSAARRAHLQRKQFQAGYDARATADGGTRAGSGCWQRAHEWGGCRTRVDRGAEAVRLVAAPDHRKPAPRLLAESDVDRERSARRGGWTGDCHRHDGGRMGLVRRSDPGPGRRIRSAFTRDGRAHREGGRSGGGQDGSALGADARNRARARGSGSRSGNARGRSDGGDAAGRRPARAAAGAGVQIDRAALMPCAFPGGGIPP